MSHHDNASVRSFLCGTELQHVVGVTVEAEQQNDQEQPKVGKQRTAGGHGHFVWPPPQESDPIYLPYSQSVLSMNN